MRTLIPPPASGRAQPLGRTGRWLGFGLTARALWLIVAGLLLALPAFWRPRAVWLVVAWDLLVLALALWDALRLPRPRQLAVSRTFLDSPQLGLATRVELAVTTEADQVLDVRVTDDLHPALVGVPETRHTEVFPRDPARIELNVWPRERGEFALGWIYLRWRGVLGLAERWGAAALRVENAELDSQVPRSGGRRQNDDGQRVRVYPAHEQARGGNNFFLMRARQMERQRRVDVSSNRCASTSPGMSCEP